MLTLSHSKMYSANNNHSDNGEVSVSKAVLQPLPSEDPGKQVFADWIAVGRAYLTRAGFGPALVGDDMVTLIEEDVVDGGGGPAPTTPAATKTPSGEITMELQ